MELKSESKHVVPQETLIHKDNTGVLSRAGTHHISVGILSWLPLTPRVATLILIDFVGELRVTSICLSKQATRE